VLAQQIAQTKNARSVRQIGLENVRMNVLQLKLPGMATGETVGWERLRRPEELARWYDASAKEFVE